MLTQSRLKELLNYDPDTGIFTRRVSASNRVKIGDRAGSVNGMGYRHIYVDGNLYLAHRLAWLYVYGGFPPSGIDHINAVKDDNRIVNLREATQSENNQNRAKQSNNTSGFRGVSWHATAKKWHARIGVGNKLKHIGLFDTPEAAHAAYLAAKAELHKFNPVVTR